MNIFRHDQAYERSSASESRKPRAEKAARTRCSHSSGWRQIGLRPRHTSPSLPGPSTVCSCIAMASHISNGSTSCCSCSSSSSVVRQICRASSESSDGSYSVNHGRWDVQLGERSMRGERSLSSAEGSSMVTGSGAARARQSRHPGPTGTGPEVLEAAAPGSKLLLFRGRITSYTPVALHRLQLCSCVVDPDSSGARSLGPRLGSTCGGGRGGGGWFVL